MLYPRVEGCVSVIVTCYNVEHYIEDCLDSLYEQTYQNFEVIVINDASTDHTQTKIDDWRTKRLPTFPVECVTLPRNVGFSGALTIGYYLAKGEYIAVQDGDDLSHRERLEKQVHYLRQHPDIMLVGSNYMTFPHGQFHQQKPVHWLKFGADIRQTYWEGGHCICHGTALFRGEAFDTLGGPTRRIKGAEDYEFIAKCLNASYQVDNLTDILYYYRLHEKQRSNEFFGKGSQA
ncbi:glycosyltransferase [Fictibacillus macauensis ZFHKF-1]|uniref:Glycosyltransferase n=1 Tax=Fictibacillus macauensis ZFHKF-1 TaxID=1196324 RepID=I8UIM0_9BACL|nr:glycosyltransferase family 2 protein [Fictibacillus macauensis]EIT86678.1 glycosyltransferase [Fictibacillus macauensis ZFHKF-1]